jgi:hypothetical protein
VNSNLVHLALFFRIAELFPQDEFSETSFGMDLRDADPPLARQHDDSCKRKFKNGSSFHPAKETRGLFEMVAFTLLFPTLFPISYF